MRFLGTKFFSQCKNSELQYNVIIMYVSTGIFTTMQPNNYVFPGGVIDRFDFSPKWLDVFGASLPPQVNPFSSIAGLTQPGRLHPPAFDDTRESPLPGDVAFRICAIRETFEEAGVLLVGCPDLPVRLS